jgi:hypothetical protein
LAWVEGSAEGVPVVRWGRKTPGYRATREGPGPGWSGQRELFNIGTGSLKGLEKATEEIDRIAQKRQKKGQNGAEISEISGKWSAKK